MLAVLSAATVANAEPRFGAVMQTGVNNNGANIGAILTDDMYNFSVLLGNTSTDATGDPSQLTIDINANYKIAVDPTAAVTVGVGFTMFSGDNLILGTQNINSEHDASSRFSFNVGFEKALTSNLHLLADVQAFSSTKVKTKNNNDEGKQTGIFNSGRVGVAYLF